MNSILNIAKVYCLNQPISLGHISLHTLRTTIGIYAEVLKSYVENLNLQEEETDYSHSIAPARVRKRHAVELLTGNFPEMDVITNKRNQGKYDKKQKEKSKKLQEENKHHQKS